MRVPIVPIVAICFLAIFFCLYNFSYTYTPYYGEKYSHISKDRLNNMNINAQDFMRFLIKFYSFIVLAVCFLYYIILGYALKYNLISSDGLMNINNQEFIIIMIVYCGFIATVLWLFVWLFLVCFMI